jgi:hypothetical protein
MLAINYLRWIYSPNKEKSTMNATEVINWMFNKRPAVGAEKAPKENKPPTEEKVMEPRPSQAQIIQSRAEKCRKESELREIQRQNENTKMTKAAVPNRIDSYSSIEEERKDRNDSVTEQIRIMRAQLPALLNKLAKIKDPRNPNTIKHKLTVLLIYGILLFVFQRSSGRAANREMTSAQFYENIRALFPEIDSVPHHDTLKRLLERIEVQEIEEAHIAMVRKLIRNKKFKKYLINNCYPIAIDGTQKFVRKDLWNENLLQRTIKKGDDTELQYYVYVIEANLVFHNGMTIPLLSEFLNYKEGDTDNNKQDCETRGFKRLTERLKTYFSHLPILILIDGLYPNGPIIEHVKNLHFQFMMVLKDGSLPSVWKEANSLIELSPNNHHKNNWGDRQQDFWWINNIEYYYGKNEKKKSILHVVVCNETWEEIDEMGELQIKKSKHAWLSSVPLKKENLHDRCNLAARHRWGIESSILKEKRQGYHYEHCFSKNWNAMIGYHYLMRIGHFLNELVHYSKTLVTKVREKTMRGFIQFIFETCKAPWLDLDEIKAKINIPYRYQLE